MPGESPIWEAVSRRPDTHLRDVVLSYTGYVEQAAAPKRRLEVPFAGIPMILADVAYASGYADQAHLNRDFRAFAGTTPTDYAARLLPGGAGVAGDGLPHVQSALVSSA